MEFVPYVLDSDSNIRVPVIISRMSDADALSTLNNPQWQTDWTSEFISDTAFDKYAFKADNGELIALAAYEIQKEYLVVHIVYMESSPKSNPLLVEHKKYNGIGRVIIAYGIKLSIDNGFGGTVLLEGKTDRLTEHYIKDFDALLLPNNFGTVHAPRLMIDNLAAKNIFLDYLV